MDTQAQQDPAKEAAPQAAIRALDRGNARAGAGPSWHEQDARRILFLTHRYDAGEWRGAAARRRDDGAARAPPRDPVGACDRACQKGEWR